MDWDRPCLQQMTVRVQNEKMLYIKSRKGIQIGDLGNCKQSDIYVCSLWPEEQAVWYLCVVTVTGGASSLILMCGHCDRRSKQSDTYVWSLWPEEQAVWYLCVVTVTGGASSLMLMCGHCDRRSKQSDTYVWSLWPEEQAVWYRIIWKRISY
jgi:hypothetical protein